MPYLTVDERHADSYCRDVSILHLQKLLVSHLCAHGLGRDESGLIWKTKREGERLIPPPSLATLAG